MSQPAPYVRVYNFTSFSSTNPNDQQPGNQLDAEYNALKTTTDQIRANMALLQKDDTTLVNNSVGRAQLKSEVVAGINTPAAWVTATAYTVRDSVLQSTKWYWCNTSHTSSAAFVTDVANWTLIADFALVGNTVNAQFKNSAGDTTSGLFTDKVVEGTGVDFVTLNPGGDEIVRVDVDTTEIEEFLALSGKLIATITSGTTAMTDRRRYRITGGTGTLPTMAAGSFVIVELAPATSSTATVARNAQTIDGAAADDTYATAGAPYPVVLYRYSSAGAVTSQIIGSTM